jgi:hypothetical protein
MSYAHKLKYAGSDPFQYERARVEDDDDPLTHQIQEQLEQDQTYVRLAQVRFLADELENDVSKIITGNVPRETKNAMFDAVANTDAPLATAVDAYVDHFISEWDDQPKRPRRSEPADFGGGESTGVQDLLGGDDDE